MVKKKKKRRKLPNNEIMKEMMTKEFIKNMEEIDNSLEEDLVDDRILENNRDWDD